MKFIIKRVSCYNRKPIDNPIVLKEYSVDGKTEGVYGIEINSLEELIEFKNSCSYPIIISRILFEKDFKEYKYVITIYDDYIE